MDTTDANREAIERVLASEPWLVGVKPAAEVVPRFAPNLILHAALPGSWDDLSDLLRGGLVGAALFEQLAATEEEAEAKLRMGEIGLGAAQDHSAMAGGAGSITAPARARARGQREREPGFSPSEGGLRQDAHPRHVRQGSE